ncbi:MAG: hypothetical protein IPK82_29005 [Polyangiaceae bacterium]|nr:hypothetical protein [Polyangiaceae bacterium]
MTASAKKLPNLVPASVLTKKCASFLGRTGAFADKVSLPFAVPHRSGLTLGVMLAATRPSGDANSGGTSAASHLEPVHLILGAAGTGDFVELRAVDPITGDADDPTPPTPPADPGADRARLIELLDALLPVFAAGKPAATKASEAGELSRLYTSLREPDLLPYYRTHGKRFFDWLDSARAS